MDWLAFLEMGAFVESYSAGVESIALNLGMVFGLT